jgi:hypothetical protein
MGRAAETTKIFAMTFAVAAIAHAICDPRWGAVGAAVASLSRDVVAVPLCIAIAAKAGLILWHPRGARGGAIPERAT